MFLRFFLACCFSAAIIFCCPSVFAGKVELTTYYPAPYGEYKQLKVTNGTTAKPDLEILNMNTDNVDAHQRFHIGNLTFYSMGLDVSDGGKFKINYGANIGDNDHFTMDTAGNVGLGTTSPQGKLHVNGMGVFQVTSASGPGLMVVRDLMPMQAIATIQMDLLRNGSFDLRDNTGNFRIGLNAVGPSVFNGGNVGIGAISPGQKLDITGGNGRVASGYSWLTNSDARLKKNVTTLDGSLEKMLAVRGVQFDLVADKELNPGKGKHIGFIAQELETEFPELVVTDEMGMKAVAYDKMTPVLVEAVKEQQQQIELLKKEVAELKKAKTAS
jgi:hypothetical protein